MHVRTYTNAKKKYFKNDLHEPQVRLTPNVVYQLNELASNEFEKVNQPTAYRY